MRYLFLLFIFCILSCTKYNEIYCYVVDYIEVEGELIEMQRNKCHCFPGSKPQGVEEYEYENKIYKTIKSLECY